MRSLADENVRADIVDALGASGHNVVSALDYGQGATDHEILRRSVEEDRVVITFDKGDFGRLVFHEKEAAVGVIVVRIAASTASRLTRNLLEILNSRSGWPGFFWTITEHQIRRRRLPSPDTSIE